MKRISLESAARVGDRRIIASVSGGKDSAAMVLALREAGLDVECVFQDTGWDHPVVLEYLRGPLTKALGPIREVGAPLKMVDLIRKRGMFPSRIRRFCTQELKVFPMRDFLNARMDAGEDVLNSVGIRAEESAPRAQMPEWEWQNGYDCEVWRPILRWTLDDVIEIHKRHDLAPCPLYMRGHTRVGCWPCVYANKHEIRRIALEDPERIDLIRQLEAEVADKAAARYAEKGETFESLGYVRPAWFQAKVGRGGEPWPIDKVLEWALNDRNEKEADRFAADSEGCVRWGLCDLGVKAREGGDGDNDAGSGC